MSGGYVSKLHIPLELESYTSPNARRYVTAKDGSPPAKRNMQNARLRIWKNSRIEKYGPIWRARCDLRNTKRQRRHMIYRQDSERSEYNNNSEEGVISRRTPYGFGIPIQDIRRFNGKALYDEKIEEWKRMLWKSKRSKCQRNQVCGRIAVAHGYNSRAQAQDGE